MEREYQLFCDRCGQRLNWSRFDDVEVRYIGWDGLEDNEDEESDAGGEQEDDCDQEDTSKIDWKPRFPVAPVYHKIRKKSALSRRLFEIFPVLIFTDRTAALITT